MQYVLLIFTIVELLDGPVHGGNHLFVFNCNHRYIKALITKVLAQTYFLAHALPGMAITMKMFFYFSFFFFWYIKFHAATLTAATVLDGSVCNVASTVVP
jgi:hypothetical protein